MVDGKRVTRRDFLRLAGAAPLVAGVAASGSRPACAAESRVLSPGPEGPSRVATVPLGTTGARVPRLGLGVDEDLSNSLLLLKQAVEWGVTLWDTAQAYEFGDAERGIGRYFRRFPEDRARVLVSTKTMERGGPELERQFEQSLRNLRVESLDFFYLHAVGAIAEVTDEARRFAEREKARGRIRHFGFSTHADMPALLTAAARMPWIDVVEVKYNYRLMEDLPMRQAMEACGRAGKGIVVMKVLAETPLRRENPEDMRLAGHFLERGFTPAQAAIKAVWENGWVSCASLHATSTEALAGYVAAALDRTSLSGTDLDRLQAHARATRHTFCASCASRCQPASGNLPVSDVLRFLMYSGRAGGMERARREFAGLSGDVRQRLATADLAAAERACPNALPIAELVREALRRLA